MTRMDTGGPHLGHRGQSVDLSNTGSHLDTKTASVSDGTCVIHAFPSHEALLYGAPPANQPKKKKALTYSKKKLLLEMFFISKYFVFYHARIDILRSLFKCL